MSKLCITLPPFAPDFSGAASALFDLGGMVVIHDASGCTGSYTGYDEPRWYANNSAVFCSGLRHMDAVLGDDEKFIKRMEEAAESLHPRFIAILGSPVPMVIGTDFVGFANDIEYRTGIPAIGIATHGLAYYGKGIVDAMVALMKKFVKEKRETIPGTINLLGITPLDFHTNGNSEDFRLLFERHGINVLASYSMGMQIEDLQNSVAAQWNVAVSQAGVELAKYMEKEHGIPYVVVTPLGNGDLAVEKVKHALNGEQLDESTSDCKEAEILIVGEQVISNSIREYLQKYHQRSGIVVAGLFDISEEWMQPGDIAVKHELQLRKLLNSKRFKAVVGDPMLKDLITPEAMQTMNFYEMPHVALSSKVHWDEHKRFLSTAMEAWLREIKTKEY